MNPLPALWHPKRYLGSPRSAPSSLAAFITLLHCLLAPTCAWMVCSGGRRQAAGCGGVGTAGGEHGSVPMLLLWLVGAVGVLPLLGSPTVAAVPEPSAGPVPGGQCGAYGSAGSCAWPVPAWPLPAHGEVCGLLSFAHQLACVTA